MFRNAQPGGSGCGLKPALTAVLIVMASAFLTLHEATRMPLLEQKNPKKSRPSGACCGHTVRHRNVRDGTHRCDEPSWAGPAALPRGRRPPWHSQRVHVWRREPALTSRPRSPTNAHASITRSASGSSWTSTTRTSHGSAWCSATSQAPSIISGRKVPRLFGRAGAPITWLGRDRVQGTTNVAAAVNVWIVKPPR